MAQINPKVGAIDDNAAKIMDIIKKNQKAHDLIIFPELALSAYPCEDLLLRDDFYHQAEQALKRIADIVEDSHVIVGYPRLLEGRRYNAAAIIHQGQLVDIYHKQKLPNYDVFDERRYFSEGEARACVFSVNQRKIGLCICEDIWQAGPVKQIQHAKAEILVCINASPFDYEKHIHRDNLVQTHARDGLSIIYVNMVGAQDELVFDGQSMVYDANATLCARSEMFQESLDTVHIAQHLISGKIIPRPDEVAILYKALVCGTRDYIRKNHFPGALLGLSGGIDSALTLAVAVDAIGAEQVHAVLLPSRYTSDESNVYAMQQLKTLGVSHSRLSIEASFNAVLDTLAPEFEGLGEDVTEQNIQARLRGLLLMALSNKQGKILLSTSNKSETAVGYTTLYGDMSGGFAVLKDVLKTQVYALAEYVNRDKEIIPQAVIDRAPSAELAANQKDQDTLPDYEILDAIIEAFMLKNQSIEAIIKLGFEKSMVQKVIQMIVRNEYKRHQAAPGVKISPRAFGKDWRYPITSGAFKSKP